MKKLLIVTGSVRAGRAADNVLALVSRELEKRGNVAVTIADFAALPLPFFDDPISPKNESFAPANANVQAWTGMVKAADAVLFITPEYNASVSGVLKNAIDWVGTPWEGKPVALIGYGWSGGDSARNHLVDIMTRLKAEVLEPQAGLAFMQHIGLDGSNLDSSAKEIGKVLAALTRARTLLSPARS